MGSEPDKSSSTPNKIPVIEGMIQAAIPYINTVLSIISRYISVTLFLVGPALGITDLALWVQNGIFNSVSPTDIQCYSSYNSTPKEMIFKQKWRYRYKIEVTGTKVKQLAQKRAFDIKVEIFAQKGHYLFF